MIRVAHALNRLDGQLDHLGVGQHPQVAEKVLVSPALRNLDARPEKLLTGQPSPALQHLVQPVVHRAGVLTVAKHTKLRVDVLRLGHPARVRLDVVADRASVKALAPGQFEEPRARHHVALPDGPAVLDVRHAHVRIEIPDRRVGQERQRVGFLLLRPPPRPLIEHVAHAHPALNQRTLEDARAVEVAVLDHLFALALVVRLGKLVVDGQHHRVSATFSDVEHRRLDLIALRRCALGLGDQLHHVAQLGLRQRGLRRRLDNVVAVAAGREQQIEHAGGRGAHLGLRPLHEHLGALADGLHRLGRVDALELAQVFQPADLSLPALAHVARELGLHLRAEVVPAGLCRARLAALQRLALELSLKRRLLAVVVWFVHQYPALEAGPAYPSLTTISSSCRALITGSANVRHSASAMSGDRTPRLAMSFFFSIINREPEDS